MTPLVVANFPIAALFILAWVGIPLWMVLRRPDRRPWLRGENQAAKGHSVLHSLALGCAAVSPLERASTVGDGMSGAAVALRGGQVFSRAAS